MNCSSENTHSHIHKWYAIRKCYSNPCWAMRPDSEYTMREREEWVFINETKAYWHRCDHDYYIANRASAVTSSAHRMQPYSFACRCREHSFLMLKIFCKIFFLHTNGNMQFFQHRINEILFWSCSSFNFPSYFFNWIKF